MAAIPNDSLLYYDGGQLKKISSTNTIEITGGFTAGSLTTLGTVSGASGTFSGNVAITGNLTVGGKITSADRVNVALGDAYIDLLASNTVTGSATAGGMTVNIEAQTSTFSGTAFTAGVPAGTQPYITVSTDPTGDFSPDDIIQVSGTKDGQNDGLYVVASTSTAPNRIYVKGVGTTPVSTQTPFIQNDFSTTTGETADVVGAKVAVWTVSNGALFKAGPTAIAAGTWAYHTGTTDAAFINSWSALTAVTVSLQAAYDGGNSITLTSGNDFIINKPTSGTAAISLESNLASDFTVVGAPLTLDASRIDLATGNVNFAKAGTILANTGTAAAGDVVYFDSSFVAQQSDNNGSAAALNVDGVVATAGASGYVATVQGTRVFVAFTAAPSAGDTAWLSATAGQATATLPTSPARIYRLGRVTGVSAGGLYEVVWNPQYIADV